MKKSIKILVLALTLALVCGVLAISAFAGVGHDYANHEAATGETVYTYMDFDSPSYTFESATAKDLTADQSYSSNSGKQFMLVFAQRSGKAWIETVPQQENKYLVIWNDATTLAVAGKGPYFTMAINDNPSNGADMDGKDNAKVSSYQAQVFDFDIKLGEGTIPTGTGPEFHFRRYTGSGRDFLYFFDYTNIAVRFRTSGGKHVLYSQAPGWVDSKAELPIDQWMHFTCVLKTTAVDNGTEATDDDYINVDLYVYINDTLALSVTDTFKTNNINTADKFYNNDPLNSIGMPEIRWSFGPDNVANAAKISLDNMSFRRFDNSYDMTGLNASFASGDLSTWAGSVYDADLLPYGKTVATIERDGDTLEFDTLPKAIAGATEGETIKLMANSTAQIAVNKVITIEKNGYTANLTAAQGYAVFDGDADEVEGNEGTYYVQESSGTLRVMWQACACGNHAAATVNVPLNNNIYDSCPAPECSYRDGTVLKVLTGWTAAGNAGITGTLSEDAVVTAAMLGKTLRLTPVYTEYTKTAEILNADGTTKEIYFSDTTLGGLLGLVQDGETIKLFGDYVNSDGMQVNVSKNATIDLNGHRIATLVYGDKYSTIGLSKDLHIISSVPGGQMFNARTTNGTSFTGAPIFVPTSSNAKLYIDGADDEGNTTVCMYCATIMQNWSSPAQIYIDGGEYYRTASDNYAFIDFKAGSIMELRNALFYGGGNFIRNTNNPDTAPIKRVVIDGCYINAVEIAGTDDRTCDDLTVTITNSFIDSGVTVNKGTWTFGEGVYFSAKATVNESNLAEGTKAFDINYVHTYTTHANKFAYDSANSKYADSTYDAPAAENSVEFVKLILAENAEPVRVTWYDTDGVTVLGVTEDSYAGLVAAAPVTEVAGTNGWVKASYSDWSEGAKIPAGVTEYAFTLQSTDDVIYSAGKVNVMFNFDLIAHYQYNFYVPVAPEGVTFTGVAYGGNLSGTGAPGAASVTDTSGNKYYTFARWPGAAGVSGESTITVNYTYEGATLAYTAPAFSIADYVEFIIDDAKYEGTPLETAMADMLRYVKAACGVTGKATSANFNAIYAKAEAYMTPDADLKTENIDLTDAMQYIEDIQIGFNTGLNGMSIAVVAKEGYAIGFKPVVSHGMNIIGQSRMINNDAETNTFRAHNIRTWGIAETFTIEIYDGYHLGANGQDVLLTGHELIATFDYSIAAYLGANAESLSDVELEFVKAILAYGASAGEYLDWKVANGIGR